MVSKGTKLEALIWLVINTGLEKVRLMGLEMVRPGLEDWKVADSKTGSKDQGVRAYVL